MELRLQEAADGKINKAEVFKYTRKSENWRISRSVNIIKSAKFLKNQCWTEN